jgi:hypothetical protein
VAQFVNYTGGGSPVTPQSAALAASQGQGASGASGLPAYQPVPDSANFLAMLASLQGQPTLQSALSGITGTPPGPQAGVPAASGAVTGAPGHTSAGAGGYGVNNAPGTPDVNASWIDANTPFNSPGFMQALQARQQAGVAALASHPPTVNPFANSNPGSPLQRLAWTGFTQGTTNPFSGQVGGRQGPFPTGTSPFPANPNGTTPVPPAGSTGIPAPPTTWSYGDQLLGHGAGPVVPNNPVTNTQGPSLPQSPWSHLANHLRNPNGTTPVGPAQLQPTNV